MNLTSKIKSKYNFIRRKIDQHPLIKFFIVVALFLIYLFFATQNHGIKEGFLIGFLTWSFFVLCTPISDAGILIDFPIELVTGIKMIYSEVIVWIIAISLNIFIYFQNPEIYNNTVLLALFKHIIEEPIPYWGIIILSFFGTFLSLFIADSFINKKTKVKQHANYLIKHKLIIFIIILFLNIAIYDFLLNKLEVTIPYF
jgi:hypothetical protein